eukprot:TRINITY_DN23025_c0_g1_i1.p1 TRINITY_DN23025_c0_g1~~TRINITY_DN23025_c0_g1_i1.p1  ORF type:complete len:204 (-),score=23.64 TRINITY_DN23025_c0_g1_i1:72-683(-)
MRDPEKDARIWASQCDKFEQDFSKTLSYVETRPDATYGKRLLVRGEPITLTGFTRRKDLHGSQGEVLSGIADEQGRVPVRIFDRFHRGGFCEMNLPLANLAPRSYNPLVFKATYVLNSAPEPPRNRTTRSGSNSMVSSIAPSMASGAGMAEAKLGRLSNMGQSLLQRSPSAPASSCLSQKSCGATSARVVSGVGAKNVMTRFP